MTIRTEKKQIFNPNDFLEQYRNLSIDTVVERVGKTLETVAKTSEDNYTGLLGTIRLADGRQAKVELKIDAEYITEEVRTDNLDLFPGAK